MTFEQVLDRWNALPVEERRRRNERLQVRLREADRVAAGLFRRQILEAEEEERDGDPNDPSDGCGPGNPTDNGDLD